MQRRAADEVDAQLGIASVEPLAQDLRGELRARDRVGARVADLAFADVAREIADAHLELRRPRAAARAAHGDAIGRGLRQRDRRRSRR